MRKINRNVFFYTSVILLFGFFIWGIIDLGTAGEIEKSSNAANQIGNPELKINDLAASDEISIHQISKGLNENLHHPLAILILQIILIIIAARLFGNLFTKLGIPSVLGEILAGIILGTSVLGTFFPALSDFIFPEQSLNNLNVLSQIGLIFFMFIIGMELDIDDIRKRANKAVVISHTSIFVAYSFGLLLAFFLYEQFAGEGVSFLHFALFMGIAMSIAAFPVLARIVQEKDLLKTPFGSLVITCAAIDDLTAWCILATVVAIVNAGTVLGALLTVTLALIYIFVMMTVVRPFLKRLGAIYITEESLNKTVVAFVILILLISSYMTEVIGIHALFGAFIAGTIMPASVNFKRIISEKFEDLSLVVLLPLFFVFTGLRTQIGLLNEPYLWLICLLIVVTAIAGKAGGTLLASRFVGLSWKDSLSLGALMNTRGLMELIVLNIGYDLGVLSPEIFAMLVIMALVTTFLTGPLLNIINKIYLGTEPDVKTQRKKEIFKLLLSFGPSKMGSTLLLIADKIRNDAFKEREITAMHLTPDSDIQPNDARIFQKESFAPIKKSAKEMNLKINTRYKATDEVQREIIRTANKEEFDFLLLGGAKSPFTEDKLGGKIRMLIENTDCDVGVFIDNNFEKVKNVLIILNDNQDAFLKKYLNNFIKEANTTIVSNNIAEIKSGMFIDQNQNIEMKNLNEIEKSGLNNYDLVISSLNCWQQLDNDLVEKIENEISVLIIKGK